MSNFKFNSSEIDKFTNELNAMVDKVDSINGSKVSFDILFNREFMKLHTDISTFDDFLEQSGFKADTEEDFEAIPDDVLDKYVSKHTEFTSWNEMLEAASVYYLEQQLDF